MPGFKPTEAGSYVWTADNNPLWMLNAARTRIPTTEFITEAFANSPPYWMTVSGCASGATDGSNNLRSDSYDDFADYLSEFVLHFKTVNGIEFRTLEPLNEPSANWWKAQGAQEGCHFDRPSQAQLLTLVRASLDAKGLSAVKLSAADESSFDEAVDTYNAYSDACARCWYRLTPTLTQARSAKSSLRSARGTTSGSGRPRSMGAELRLRSMSTRTITRKSCLGSISRTASPGI